MKVSNKVTKLFVAILIVLAFMVQSIAPIAMTVASAAGDTKKPTPKVTEKILYTGFEDYTIRFNNLAKGAKTSYQSQNPKIAKVDQKGVIHPILAGSTSITIKISQNNNSYTYKIEIKVEQPHIQITDYTPVIAYGAKYTLKGEAYGIKEASLSWSSSNTKVAIIDKKTGVLKGLSTGSTTITLKEAKSGYTNKVDIRIDEKYTPPTGSDKASYISGLDLSKKTGDYYTTTKEEYIETTRFVLYLEEGIKVPVKVIDLINHAMDRIEDTTGYNFYVPRRNKYDYYGGMMSEIKQYFNSADSLNAINTGHERVEIVVASNAAEDGAYASGVCGILLSPKDMTLMDGGSTALVHELLHIAWQRNGEYMGSVLCEGFAVYYAQQILKDDKALTSNYDTQEQMAGYDQLITEDNMEEVFTSTTSGYNRYKLGYCMTSYIIETYGIAAYRRVHNKVTGLKEGTDLMPLTTVATVLKSELSANFFKEFADWHNMNHKRFGDKDLTAAGEWDISYNSLNKYYGNDTKVNIPETVDYINSSAFTNCTMESVVIPNRVTTIGSGAFDSCKNLKEIEIPDSVTSIGSGAFDDCTSLKKVVLPKNLKIIEANAFNGCTSLTSIEIPEGITTIKACVFTGCTALKSITLPSTLTEMSYSIFTNCTSLASVIIPDSVNAVPEDMFNNCTSLKSITLPKNLKTIKARTFWSCTSLKKIELPKGLTTIEETAFNFAGLTAITIPNTVTTIGDYAFASNKGLKSITIPKSVKNIGKNTFYGCEGLTIYGDKGSYAEKFAKENKIKFVSK